MWQPLLQSDNNLVLSFFYRYAYSLYLMKHSVFENLMPCLKLGCNLLTDSRVTVVRESKNDRQLDIQFSCKNLFPLGNKKEKEMLKESRKYAVGSLSKSHIWWFWPQWQKVTWTGIACMGPWRDEQNTSEDIGFVLSALAGTSLLHWVPFCLPFSVWWKNKAHLIKNVLTLRVTKSYRNERWQQALVTLSCDV